MGIIRMFDATCDTCGAQYDNPFGFSSVLKEHLKKDGWRVNNKLTCPDCLPVVTTKRDIKIILHDRNVSYEDWCRAIGYDPNNDEHYNNFCEWKANS